MKKWLPDRKWLASGVSGVLTFILLTLFSDALGLDPAAATEIASGITGLVMAAVHYFVPPSVKDVIKRVDDTIIDLARKDPDSPASPA